MGKFRYYVYYVPVQKVVVVTESKLNEQLEEAKRRIWELMEENEKLSKEVEQLRRCQQSGGYVMVPVSEWLHRS